MSLILNMVGGRRHRRGGPPGTPRRRSVHRAGAVTVTVLAMVTSACTSGDEGAGGALGVVASAYPLAEAAERVGGELVSVQNLTPPGVEPHDLELTPDDLEAILGSDLVLFVGAGFQPAVEEAVTDAEGRVLDALDVVEPLPAGERAHETDGDDHAGELDPHIWLDPMRLATVATAVGDALAEVDPANADAYRANADAYVAELEALDAEFRDGLGSCSSRLLVVSHAAFGYLVDAYGLEQEAIAGISPETEPDPARLAELAELVREEGVTTIFTETLVAPDVAETLAGEAGVTTAVLNPIEGLTDDQLEAGEDYGSVMRRNLQTLRGALGCR